MFITDFHVAQGVLAVDATLPEIANLTIFLHPSGDGLLQSISHLFSMSIGCTEVLTGDAPVFKFYQPINQQVLLGDTSLSNFSTVLKPMGIWPDDTPPPQPKNILNYLQASNQLASNLNGNNLFEANSAAFVVMLNPGDAPPPNPH